MIDETFLALLSTRPAEQLDAAPINTRWTPSRKAALVFAVKTGRIDAQRARVHFRLSDEELQSWIAAIETNGVPGLRITRYQIYRDNPPPRGNRAPLPQTVTVLTRSAERGE